MPNDQQARSDWIRNVLGITISGSSTGTNGSEAAAFSNCGRRWNRS